jgi:hypothetical protein
MRRIIKKILPMAVSMAVLTAVLAVLPGLIFTACGQLEDKENFYTITFFADYPVKEKKVDRMVIKEGPTAGQTTEFEYEIDVYKVLLNMSIQTNGLGRLERFPADPQRPDDYIFDGWFIDGNTRVTKHTIFTSHTRVTAKWKAGASIQIGEGPVAKEFAKILAALAAGRADSEYTVDLTADEALLPQTLEYSGANKVTVILNGITRADGIDPVISIFERGSLFTVGKNVTLSLRNNIWLKGNGRNTRALVTVNDGGTLIIGEEARICYNGSEDEKSGGGVTVNRGGEFIMNGGEIYQCTVIATPYDDPEGFPGGGGVLVRGGTFTMIGGNIENCYGRYNGGGVYADMGGKFKMKGGRIYDNSAPYGGGVTTHRGGLFEMEGGEIHLNLAVFGGGVFVDQGATDKLSHVITVYDPAREPNFPGMTFEDYHAFYDPDIPINDPRKKEGFYISGGKIYENHAYDSGGGVCNFQGGITYMTGGEVNDNNADYFGAGVYNVGLFKMMDGDIQENYGRYGGGVCADGGMFVMENGSINQNRATQFGGGVFVYGGQFAIHGGEISGNMGDQAGGGLALMPSANAFAMSGGVIMENVSANYPLEGTLCFLNSADPNQIGLAYYGTRPPGALPGDSAVIPIGHEANVNGTNTFIWESYLAEYKPNNSGVPMPQPYANYTALEVRDGVLYVRYYITY